MSKSGIKESLRSRKVGSHVLELPPIAERGGTQDFLARHEQHGTRRRIRIFSNVLGMSPELATALRDAATREFLATERLHVDGVIRALDQIDTELGPAVVYDHHPDAVRLDRFLALRGDELDLVTRLRIVGRIAEILHVIHGRRITHRMLTPQSIWLRPAAPDELDAAGPGRQLAWVPEISDLSMATREPGSTTGATLLSRTGHFPTAAAGDIERVLADPAAESYLAPEAYTDPDPDGQALDIFSVGAIAYLLCADRPPALTRHEMKAALGTTGLQLSSVLPDVDLALDELIREATCPVVTERFARMADLVAAVELAVEALTTDAAPPADDDIDRDPLTVGEGDMIGGRFLVEDQLGQGSSARALLCLDETTNDLVVLKVPLDGTSVERVDAEARALQGLRHPGVVELFDEVELAGRPTLVLAFAGRESLAVELRRHGPATPEFLERWGTDLLDAVRFLEREGRSHRDIKPDNLGIVQQGKSKERHLVLFDFSLAATPSSDTTAGTPGYLEPFLDDRDPPGWDLAAERYAAAVTLHEMATGELPVWGDGRTNPAYTTGDASLAVDLFDPDLRGPARRVLHPGAAPRPRRAVRHRRGHAPGLAEGVRRPPRRTRPDRTHHRLRRRGDDRRTDQRPPPRAAHPARPRRPDHLHRRHARRPLGAPPPRRRTGPRPRRPQPDGGQPGPRPEDRDAQRHPPGPLRGAHPLRRRARRRRPGRPRAPTAPPLLPTQHADVPLTEHSPGEATAPAELPAARLDLDALTLRLQPPRGQARPPGRSRRHRQPPARPRARRRPRRRLAHQQHRRRRCRPLGGRGQPVAPEGPQPLAVVTRAAWTSPTT